MFFCFYKYFRLIKKDFVVRISEGMFSNSREIVLSIGRVLYMFYLFFLHNICHSRTLLSSLVMQ